MDPQANETSLRFQLSAMAVEVPDQDHPNRMPFSGVLTKVDEPSDNPPGGSNGKRVLIPRAVAEEALDSLALMAVDYKDGFAGHEPTQKIGVITEAWIDGNDLKIRGFLYAHDFPDICADVQKYKDKLGFSYEAQVLLDDLKADVLEVTFCLFTGAAVMLKDKAAYTTTSITASADKELKMTPEELQALFASALAPITEQLSNVTKELAEVKAGAATVHAGSVNHIVKPHAEALRNAADSLEKAGIGLDPKRGHVALLRDMADKMEAESHLGKVSNVYQTPDFFYASAEIKDDPRVFELQKQVAELQAAAANANKAGQAAQFAAAAEPQRKTLPPAIASLLSKAGVSLEAAGEQKLTVEQVDKVLAGLPSHQRIAKKLELQAAGVL
ncbi:hypothetical protein JFK97_06780 [Chromobacterium phragmitis]|uniref:hypothetical protein n=1 Tax=Chromobacterium amazonense TaxID=1382803 RepID=UPI0021B77A91|nr:hypothetical protein [Chromobacterium amazonense]MBM2884092.1 hypothetical protein [Chromobacterium amazonense]